MPDMSPQKPTWNSSSRFTGRVVHKVLDNWDRYTLKALEEYLNNDTDNITTFALDGVPVNLVKILVIVNQARGLRTENEGNPKPVEDDRELVKVHKNYEHSSALRRTFNTLVKDLLFDLTVYSERYGDSFIFVLFGGGAVHPQAFITAQYLQNEILFWNVPRQIKNHPQGAPITQGFVDGMSEVLVKHYASLSIRASWKEPAMLAHSQGTVCTLAADDDLTTSESANFAEELLAKDTYISELQAGLQEKTDIIDIINMENEDIYESYKAQLERLRQELERCQDLLVEKDQELSHYRKLCGERKVLPSLPRLPGGSSSEYEGLSRAERLSTELSRLTFKTAGSSSGK